MVIREVSGDILATHAVAIVNPVNTDGVMGAGLAKSLKSVYPGMFAGYRDACQRGALRIGSVWTYPTGHPRLRYVVCLPTKRHWRNDSQIDDIYKGLLALRDEIEHLHLPSIAVPALGCGLGRLPWEPVRDVIYTVLNGMQSVAIELYLPRDTERS